jgi:hypothetical protein
MSTRNTLQSSKTRHWILGVGTGLILLAAGLAWRKWPSVEGGLTARPGSAADVPAPADETPVRPAVKPPPTPVDGYVGSEACGKCHAAIAESYRLHPMYRSAGRVPGENEVEDFEQQTEFEPPGNRRYRVEHTKTEVIHHEFMVDSRGEVIDDLAVSQHLFIGSGTRGKTYAVNRGGRLFESVISWFSPDGGRWGLSPGYEPLSQRNFERRIGGACITCHAGRVANVPGENDTFEEPLFLEEAIGCERCHGPGEKHVVRQEEGKVIVGHDDSIVNPGRLDPARRESVCNQCHLQGEQSVPRYGRTFYDFRPGQLLDDVWTVSVEGNGVRFDGMTRAVSQVQQMRASACYQQSEGRMSCNSCHPAHTVPDSGAKADYFRGRCMECHAERGCSLPEIRRGGASAEKSCIDCHMPRLATHDIPHLSQTDHRVGRSPNTQLPNDPNPPLVSNWELFDHAEERLERWEVDRVRGLNRVHVAQRNKLSAPVYLREAEPLLRSALRAAPDDVRVLEALGQAMFGLERAGEAREFFERVLEIQPFHERSLEMLMEICHGAGDFNQGTKYGERLLKVDPWIVRYYARQADMLRGIGQLEKALERGEQALRLDPWQTQIRSWLTQAYRIAGDESAAVRHADVLRRIRGG